MRCFRQLSTKLLRHPQPKRSTIITAFFRHEHDPPGIDLATPWGHLPLGANDL